MRKPLVQARKDDVLNAYVTVTQVNEIGAISGDPEPSVPENHTGAIARYQLDDPENGCHLMVSDRA